MEPLPLTLDVFISFIFFCFIFGLAWPVLSSVVTHRQSLRTQPALLAALAGALGVIACAIWAWNAPTVQHSQPYFTADLPENFPQIAFQFYTDRLTAFFLLLTGVFTLAVVLHLVDWLEGVHNQPLIVAVFNLFVLSIVFVVLSDTIYSFLFFQECMTLSFAYLALYRHSTYLEQTDIPAGELEASKTAFKSYLIFEHIGFMFVAVALLMLSISAGSPAFTGLSTASQIGVADPQSLTRDLIFLLALAGFGIKAGIFPAYIWVPMVHPYSPTSIHAMMSGIALKVAGIYGMYRVFFNFLAPAQWWWGWIVLLLAGVTALFGVFYALLGKDLKTTLASHSVENIGIILAGIGLALIFSAHVGKPTSPGEISPFANLTSLSLIASLYHLLNHSVFKGLLFFCTGAIENRTGTVALDRLGGLMNRYPLTSATFLVGAVSIAGFPPFNGFISEWLLLQTFFAGMDLYLTGERIYYLIGLVFALVCLVLAFALTAYAFVKISGEVLLGFPRSPEVVQNARKGEVKWHIKVVLIVFALFCLLLGILPAQVTSELGQLCTKTFPRLGNGENFIRANSIVLVLPVVDPENLRPGQPQLDDFTLDENNYQTRLSTRMILAVGTIVAFSVLVGVLFRLPFLRRRLTTTASQPWACGIPYAGRSMQYTGAAFASLVWKPFENRLRPSASGETAPPVEEEFLLYREKIIPGHSVTEVTRLVYNRGLGWLLRLSEKIGARVQPGDIRSYLLYIFMLFLAILAAILLITEKQ